MGGANTLGLEQDIGHLFFYNETKLKQNGEIQS